MQKYVLEGDGRSRRVGGSPRSASVSALKPAIATSAMARMPARMRASVRKVGDEVARSGPALVPTNRMNPLSAMPLPRLGAETSP